MAPLPTRRRRSNRQVAFGIYRFHNANHGSLAGYGDGDFIRLRDEKGQDWQGSAERHGDCVRFSFRDGKGRYATGVGDSYGVVLRDDKGNIWRGFVQ